MPVPLAVIVGIRANSAELDRVRNVRLCLEALRTQDSNEFQVLLIEQDQAPQLTPDITRLAHRYQFAYNAGPYNRGWAFNIGARLADAEYLLLLDADVLLPRDSVRRTLALLRNGNPAVRPYTEVLFLDDPSTERVARNGSKPDLTGELFINPMGLSIAIDAALYDRIGGHDERFWGWGWEDREFWERLERNTEIAR